MITDEKRREVAENLRELAANRHYVDEYISADTVGFWRGEATEGFDSDSLMEVADLIEPAPVTGDTSDGFHTFNELYHHRAVLFSFIVTCFPGASWKSRRHHDGTMYNGMFIVGIETPWGQATYHYDAEPYWDMFPCRELKRAPKWDGHTPDQAIERIGLTARALADAREDTGAEIRFCWNAYDENAPFTCKNGFKCSVCGEKVEDLDNYYVRGTWNYCPGCGRKVAGNGDRVRA